MDVDSLPDSLILEIFRYLSNKELCHISRVCKRWNKIAKDNSLWRHIDITDAKLDLRKAWKFFRTRLSDCLLSLKLRGYYSSRFAQKQKKPVVSDTLLVDLRTKCPNIKQLSFISVYLGDISACKLPSSLTTLELTSCGWLLNWLGDADLPNLQALHFISCVRIDDSELKTVTKFSTLETLVLSQLYRVQDEGIRYITEHLPQLRHLEIDGSNITDLAVHHICRNLKHLHTLKLTSNKLLTNSAVQTICDSLPSLTSLDLSRNENLTPNCLNAFQSRKNVGTVICSFTQEEIEEKQENCRWRIKLTD